ncbi:MAG: hypothetical protein K8R92_05750 [Planctomycetes bacterium]|nr:hypothetical protein [Planctomycetota bacterium]
MNLKLDFNLDRNPTLAQIRSLPPAGRWGVLLLALVVAYFAVDALSWSWARSWNEQADRIQKILSDTAETIANNDSASNVGPETFGPAEPIGSESEGAESMAKAIVGIVKKYSTTNFGYDAQRASTRLSGMSAGGDKLSKVSGELQFECSPEVFSKIVADIESHPAIESISSIRLQRKEAERKVVVHMTVDAWVVPSKSASGGGIG